MRLKFPTPQPAFPYPSADKPLESLTLHERLVKVGRHVPCSQKLTTDPSDTIICNCLGWRPNTANNSGRADSCICGHRLSYHGGAQDEDFSRRLAVAMKIDQYLHEKDKLLDFMYEDDQVKRMRAEMIDMANFGKRRKRSESEEEEENDSKKRKMDVKEENDEDDGKLEYPEGLPSDLEFRCITNDGSRQNLILLTNLKKVFATQLPNMPKHYIARLTYDMNHHSVVLIRPTQNKYEVMDLV
ncbi:hypothetical protein G9A89_022746 [Geosiphon pyriformis]|nr:hypothetical protein G9A89_022746 [Geosiphon pyriformis]